MKIGVISDTHIAKNKEKLIKLLNEELKDVEFVIHVGDITSFDTLKTMVQLKKLVAVYGNNDGEDIRKVLKQKEIIVIEGYKIGIIHGDGASKTTIERAYDSFKGEKVDIIIFGHSHNPIVKTMNKTLMINPGSPTRKLKERWNTYIILNISKGRISVDLRFF